MHSIPHHADAGITSLMSYDDVMPTGGLFNDEREVAVRQGRVSIGHGDAQ